jgi:hypothetical protein
MMENTFDIKRQVNFLVKELIFKNVVAVVSIFCFLNYNYAQSLRASALNPNVYRTRVNLEGFRVLDKSLKKYNDKVVIDVEGDQFIDYKIVSEDEGGYTIIRVLPRVKIRQDRDIDGNMIYRVTRVHKDSGQTKTQPDNGYLYYYAIKSAEFPPLGKTLLSEKIVGVPLIHPFKLRPTVKNIGWDLKPEFTVSYSFGIRLKSRDKPFSKNYWTIIPYGFGVTQDKYFQNIGDEKEDAVAVTYFREE